MQFRFISVFLVLLNLSTVIHSQSSDSLGDYRQRSATRFVVFPVIGYAPETRIVGGLYPQFLFGDPGQSRPSSLGLSLLYSQNRQFSINIFPEFWFRNDEYRLAGELKWQYWPDKFYGIGNDTRPEDQEYYASRIMGIKLDFMKSVYRSLFAGVLLELESNEILEYDDSPGAVLPGGSVPGGDQSLISGLGAGAAWDTRDDILFPYSGSYLQFRLVWFSNFLGTTHPHSKWIIDLRKYFEFGERHLLYLQFYGKFLWGNEIPFRNMAMLGGDKLLRGYFRGRYRDHNTFLAQAEYHTPPVWRIHLVVFGGAGDVFHSASALGNISLKPSVGMGLRFKVFRDRRMNFRVDGALGKGDSGFYIRIMEAF